MLIHTTVYIGKANMNMNMNLNKNLLIYIHWWSVITKLATLVNHQLNIS